MPRRLLHGCMHAVSVGDVTKPHPYILTQYCMCLYIRGRPNFVFFFVFGAEKCIFLFFGLLFFGRKRCTYFRCILFFGTNMAVKITENSECFNSADARMARSTVNFSQHVQPQSVLGTNVVWHCVINIFLHVLSFSVATRTRIRLVIHS